MIFFSIDTIHLVILKLIFSYPCSNASRSFRVINSESSRPCPVVIWSSAIVDFKFLYHLLVYSFSNVYFPIFSNDHPSIFCIVLVIFHNLVSNRFDICVFYRKSTDILEFYFVAVTVYISIQYFLKGM